MLANKVYTIAIDPAIRITSPVGKLILGYYTLDLNSYTNPCQNCIGYPKLMLTLSCFSTSQTVRHIDILKSEMCFVE